MALAFFLSGCTVPATGLAGIGTGADGSPVGFLEVCGGHIDGATVYQTDNDHLGSWSVKPAASGYTSWSLRSGGDGWTATEPFVPLHPHQTYSLYGWTNDNSSSADAVEFTSADLASIPHGQVRYWSGSLKDNGDGIYIVGTVDQFKKLACQLYG